MSTPSLSDLFSTAHALPTITLEQSERNWRQNYISLIKHTLNAGKTDDMTTNEIAMSLYQIALIWPSKPESIVAIKECLEDSAVLFGTYCAQEIAMHLQMLVSEDSALNYCLTQMKFTDPNIAQHYTLQ